MARGAMSSSTWRDDESDRSMSNDRWNFSCSSGKDLDAQVQQRAKDDADGQCLDAQNRAEHDGARR